MAYEYSGVPPLGTIHYSRGCVTGLDGCAGEGREAPAQGPLRIGTLRKLPFESARPQNIENNPMQSSTGAACTRIRNLARRANRRYFLTIPKSFERPPPARVACASVAIAPDASAVSTPAAAQRCNTPSRQRGKIIKCTVAVIPQTIRTWAPSIPEGALLRMAQPDGELVNGMLPFVG
jgi:hypothetical protein